MKLGWSLGIAAAVLVHAALLLFGGYFFLPDAKHGAGAVQPVELLSDLDEKKDEEKPEEPQAPEEPIAADEEPPPDAEEILKSLEVPATDSTPALEAASLSAIEAALSGQGGGDFAQGLTFGSGGQIGGTGKFGDSLEKAVDDAFSLAELEQKPSVVFQKQPDYPVEMRNKKVEGVVSIRFIVDAAGKVDRPTVESSSHAAFESPALAAIKKWKFEPGLRAGQRVPSKMRVTIRFPQS